MLAYVALRIGQQPYQLRIPTLTDVFVSSSDNLLAPPVLLATLILLLLLGGRIIALMGLVCTPCEGDVGGELAMLRKGLTRPRSETVA